MGLQITSNREIWIWEEKKKKKTLTVEQRSAISYITAKDHDRVAFASELLS